MYIDVLTPRRSFDTRAVGEKVAFVGALCLPIPSAFSHLPGFRGSWEVAGVYDIPTTPRYRVNIVFKSNCTSVI